MPDLSSHLCLVEMDSQLTSPFNMKNPAKLKENKRKRKRINNEKSIFSTSQNVIFLAEDQKSERLSKPPFKFGKKEAETLNAVLADLSISSTPINFK